MGDFGDRLNSFEEEWQERWYSENLFESDPSDDDKFYITVAYPYPSGGMHIGHVRTYTLPDVFARFKRMQGYNVLFPMAWHVTGTPIIGALERLKGGDEDQIEVFNDVYNVPRDELDSWDEPMDLAEYFIENSYKSGMKRLGFSVDWRREFTTNDTEYNRFIEWQYRRLRDQDLVKQGMHPTKYCLNDENPVTTHDLLEGEEAEKHEYTLVKFESENLIFPTATLRPETVYGVTHVMVKPDEEYVVADVDGENWVVSHEAMTKLRHQDREVEKVGTRRGTEFIGEYLINPVTGEEIPVLPASFIDPDSGSGVVMSVPAHAPYDWISLQDLKESPEKAEEYGVTPDEVRGIEPKKIIDIEGYDDFPAKEACEKHGVESQSDEEALEKATEEVYEKEFHNGVLNSNCDGFASRKVNVVKDELIERFENESKFGSLYDFSEEVVCRCGGTVVVSLQDSWFLEYGDEEWKEKVRDNFGRIDIIPEDKREDYVNTINWLESWPCIRNYGLGTRLPFDDDFVVEPLSDSTVYMAFYTVSHLIDKDEGDLTSEFFDYVFKGEGDLNEVAEDTGFELETVESAKESFEYWYPLDWRTSGKDLIQNHLTFMMYHHTALFDEENWPQGIATWGMGNLEGKKMSSSKGHVVSADEAIDEYGADTVRFFLFASVEPWRNFDWRSEEVEEYMMNLKKFYDRSVELHGEGEKNEFNNLDRYVLSRLQKIVRNATEALEDFQTRKAGLNGFFELSSVINLYRKRADELNTQVINELVETQVELMAPFTPHICEELWEEIGKEGFVSEAKWPEPDESLIDEEVENAQQVVENTVEDVRELEDIVGDFDRIKIVVAEEWKREVFSEIKELVDDRPGFGEAMSQLVEGREKHAEQINNFLQNYFNNPGVLPEEIFSAKKEIEILEENTTFLENEFDASIVIEKEEDSDEDKASRSEPGRPAIVMK